MRAAREPTCPSQYGARDDATDEHAGRNAKGLDKIEKFGPDKLSLKVSAELGPGGVEKLFLGEAKRGLKIAISWDNVK